MPNSDLAAIQHGSQVLGRDERPFERVEPDPRSARIERRAAFILAVAGIDGHPLLQIAERIGYRHIKDEILGDPASRQPRGDRRGHAVSLDVECQRRSRRIGQIKVEQRIERHSARLGHVVADDDLAGAIAQVRLDAITCGKGAGERNLAVLFLGPVPPAAVREDVQMQDRCLNRCGA
jgi:hypothetical protein